MPNSSVRFGSANFSDFYLIVRFGLPNSSAKSEPSSSVSSVRPNFKIVKVRFGSAQKFWVRFTTTLDSRKCFASKSNFYNFGPKSPNLIYFIYDLISISAHFDNFNFLAFFSDYARPLRLLCSVPGRPIRLKIDKESLSGT